MHGAGAAKYAREERGAIMGKSYGHYGQSFAIPSKDEHIDVIPQDQWIRIRMYIAGFVAYAYSRPKISFMVTQIGCGLAGMTKEDVAPWFQESISLLTSGPLRNVYFDEAWEPFMVEGTKFWGTA